MIYSCIPEQPESPSSRAVYLVQLDARLHIKEEQGAEGGMNVKPDLIRGLVMIYMLSHYSTAKASEAWGRLSINPELLWGLRCICYPHNSPATSQQMEAGIGGR